MAFIIFYLFCPIDNEFETSYESSPEPTVPLPRVGYCPASETITAELPPAPASESNPSNDNGSEIYHDIDPSVLHLPYPATSTLGTGTLTSDHTYQYIEAGTVGTESNNVYDAPNQPNCGVSIRKHRMIIDNCALSYYLLLI